MQQQATAEFYLVHEKKVKNKDQPIYDRYKKIKLLNTENKTVRYYK